MRREGYKLFTPGTIGTLNLPNRLVRSATWDPALFAERKMTDQVLELYRQVAAGGVGLVIGGGLPVFEQDMLQGRGSYRDLQIEGLERIPEVVHAAGTDCRVVAQLEVGYLDAGPSDVPSPFRAGGIAPLTAAQIERIVDSFVEAAIHVRALGYDGVQLHAAHGGLLSCFLSPYTNRRADIYGGPVENRVSMVREIVSGARQAVGDFPILIKVNGTDYVPGGIALHTFPELAAEIARAGVDAIEISGGMWDCLVRGEEELGFRPVPAPESHTRIRLTEQQSYFYPYAEQLDVEIPLILVGGNRDVERLEGILRAGMVDFIALCRPLICEPDLPRRWLEGRGSGKAACISCNSCIHDMIVHPGRSVPGAVRCVFRQDRAQHRAAQAWLSSWVADNVVDREALRAGLW